MARTWNQRTKRNTADMMVFFMCVCVCGWALWVLDCVFAFLQLGDVQLWFGAVQSLEPHLVVVDGRDDGAAWHGHTRMSVSYRSTQTSWSRIITTEPGPAIVDLYFKNVYNKTFLYCKWLQKFQVSQKCPEKKSNNFEYWRKLMMRWWVTLWIPNIHV